MTISLGKNCTVERDLQKNVETMVAINRIVEDQIYRNRVKTINHVTKNENMRKNWSRSLIIDIDEQICSSFNAKHFFFVYLQSRYGSVDVTPTKNWRSSKRLKIYPQNKDHINDSAGFDFELHDTRQLFACRSGSTTKYCYFEMKGTSGSFEAAHTRFRISQNELERCRTIANDRQRQERQAYFIVIIENCLDPENISFGAVFEWYDILLS